MTASDAARPQYPALDIGGMVFHLVGRSSFLIGSEPACDVRLQHASIQPRHARLLLRDGMAWLEDLSGGRTQQAGARLTGASLRPGDSIRLGDLEIYYRLVSEVPPAQPQEARIPAASLRRALATELRRLPWLVASGALHLTVILIALALLPTKQIELGIRRSIELQLPSSVDPNQTPEAPPEPQVRADEDPKLSSDTMAAPPPPLQAEQPDVSSIAMLLPTPTAEQGLLERLSPTPSTTSHEQTRMDRPTLGSGSDILAHTSPGLHAGGFAKTVSSIRESGLDIVFVFDSTGSMSSVLQATKERVASMVEALHALVPDARIGVVTYRDRGDTGSYVTRSVPLSNDVFRAINFLQTVEASGGGDEPEAVADGLERAFDQPWRRGGRRVIVLIGDAPPKPGTDARIQGRIQKFLKGSDGVVHALLTAASLKSDAGKAFARIAKDGKGTCLAAEQGDLLLRQLLSLAFGSEYRKNIDEVYAIVQARRDSIATSARDLARYPDARRLEQAMRIQPVNDDVVKALRRSRDFRLAELLIALVRKPELPESGRHAAAHVLQVMLELTEPPVHPERGHPLTDVQAEQLLRLAKERLNK